MCIVQYQNKILYVCIYFVTLMKSFQWLQKYINKVSTCDIFEKSKLPNHVLINEYLPGQGIMV